MENKKDNQTKSKKKLGIIIVAIIIIIGIIVGGVCYFISRKNTPKYFINQTLSNLKSGNLVDVASSVEINGVTTTKEQVNQIIDKTPILKGAVANATDLSKALFGNLTYTINDVTVTNNKAVANVDITWDTQATLQSVMSYAMKNAKINPNQTQAENISKIETEIQNYIKDNPDKIKTQTYKEKMNLTKIDNKWYIDVASNIKDNLQTVMGNFAAQDMLGNNLSGNNNPLN